MTLYVSLFAFAFSLWVLYVVVRTNAPFDWQCWSCGAYRRKDADGWRVCDRCGTGHKVEAYGIAKEEEA